MTTQVETASIYDYPKYYDLLFGSDVAAEFRFLKDCFAKHAKCEVLDLRTCLRHRSTAGEAWSRWLSGRRK